MYQLGHSSSIESALETFPWGTVQQEIKFGKNIYEATTATIGYHWRLFFSFETLFKIGTSGQLI